ncbi:hypothetical protein RND81_05G196600 [Saponaria officinalis]|uniref:BRCT domain-containing protein n=1 Tax=Saponaria officinalis TaxID=3572 RepID=A0AAW1KXT4_SAPOF
MAHPSNFHSLSLGRKTDDVDQIDTEILDDFVDAVHHDTEVVHYPDSVENSETETLYGYDTEVVPDSEDELTYTSDSGRHSSRHVSFIESFAADLYKVESNSYPLRKRLDQSNMSIDACGDERHTSFLAMDMIVHKGNELRPIINHRDMQAADLALQDGKMPMVNDPRPADSKSNDSNFADDVKQMNMKSKIEKNGKLSQSKTKEIRIVYTRKTKRLGKPDIGAKDVKKLTDDNNDYGGLSYVESQEPEDVSTALLFVDQYLSVSPMPMLSSPMASVKTKQKSPPALSAKGAQRLVRWTGARKSENKAGIFEWNDSVDGDEGCIPLKNGAQPQRAFRVKKYKHTYVRRSPSVNNSMLTEQVHKNEVREDPKDELDQKTAEESTLIREEINPISEDFENVFDVGIGTQIAAEAIQALSSAVSADCFEMNADQCSKKLPEKSGEDAQKQMHAGFWSLPKKTRSAYRENSSPNNSRIFCSDHLDDIMQSSRQVARKNNGKSAAAKCVVGRRSAAFGKVKLTKKAKPYRSKDVDICKENLHGSLSVDDLPLRKPMSGRKVKNVHPASANLKSSSLFNMNEGLASKTICNGVAPVMKSGRYNNTKDSGTLGDMVDVSAEKADHSKHFGNSSLNTTEMKLNDDDKKHIEADASYDAMNATVGPECNLGQSTNWFLGDYPRGKRTRRSTLHNFVGYGDLENSSVKQSHDKDNHYPLRWRNNIESCSASGLHSGFKRKRRSTTYISPCLLSSKKSERNFTNKNVSVYDSDCAKKKNTLSEQLIKSTVNLQESAADVARCKANDDMNLIDGYLDHHDKKKPSPTALTRELHRLGFGESMPDFTPKTSRQRKTMANICVLLSQSLDKSTRKHQTKILTRFGVPVASCPSNATHFVTDRFARTRNMLEFIAQGKPVVTPQWLESCDQAGFYIEDRDYIVRDVTKECELGFRLPVSLDRARHHPLLRGYTVFITPNAKPGKEILASLVKAVHGEVLNAVVDSKLDNLLILSCDKDQILCLPFLQRGTTAYNPELLLNGIVIQKLEFARHRLFIDQVNG